jgi:hypothetical protein
MIGQGNYKYYKLQLACVEAAQALTFTLTASNGNPDVYVSREPRPTTSLYAFKSEATDAADVIEIPSPEAGTYYVRRVRRDHGDVQAAREHQDVHRETPVPRVPADGRRRRRAKRGRRLLT